MAHHKVTFPIDDQGNENGVWLGIGNKIITVVNDHTNNTTFYRPATKNHILNYKDEIKLQTQLYKVWRYERMATVIRNK